MPGQITGWSLTVLSAVLSAALVAGAAPAAAQAPAGRPPAARMPAEPAPLPPPRPDDVDPPPAKEAGGRDAGGKDAGGKEAPARDAKEPTRETGRDATKEPAGEGAKDPARDAAKDAPVPPGPAPLPPERPADLPSGPAPSPATVVPDDAACLGRLERLGVKAEPVAPLLDGMCGAARPLRVTALPDGVALAPAATLTCVAAEALGRWSTEVRVTGERTLGKAPRTLQVGGSYECRGQNHDPAAKLSEHASANGVDVMGFAFDGRAPIAVGASREGTPEAAFEAAVRARACGFFRTVLGPGSDPAHANHLHLDERERPAGHRLCQ